MTLLSDHRRAVLFVPRDNHYDKHLAVCLTRAGDERYRVGAITHDSAAVVALAEDHLIDVVLAAVRWQLGHFDELEAAIAGFGVRLDVVRDPGAPVRRRLSADPVIARLAALGVAPEIIAEAVAAPVEHVRLTLARAQGGPCQPGQRPTRTARPIVLGRRTPAH